MTVNLALRGRQVWLLVLSAGIPVSAVAQSSSSAAETDNGLLMLAAIYAVFALVYFVPSIVAFRRKHPNRWAILAINIVFGATGLGWVGSLVWACSAVHLSPTGSNGGESGLNIFANDPVHVKTVHESGDQEVDPTEKLVRLKRLLDVQAITPDEYAALRAPIIASMR